MTLFHSYYLFVLTTINKLQVNLFTLIMAVTFYYLLGTFSGNNKVKFKCITFLLNDGLTNSK
jgi:hypothetical protein